ncbi:4-alpha-glucanotransferase [Rubrobacter aplysinae]|uniref:4-alpha-glucanotransferase n=1 Tax=Rubrobacter aplysinae TaxID=909625 RepID=UPI0009FCEFFD|nr:4-alpha-glucanotransferase [Rubrobacter aplysinae]
MTEISRSARSAENSESAEGTESAGSSRSAGILLHPTSLAGPYGIGELGGEAVGFVGFLQQAGQRLWQVLPLNPPDAEGSPYSSGSAFAGSPLLVSTGRMIETGLLRRDEAPPEEPGPVDYHRVAARKDGLLRKAYARGGEGLREELSAFREAHQDWLPDYALYRALKERYGGEPWSRWPGGLAGRESDALAEARRELAGEIGFHEFVQYLFDEHWGEVRRAARGAGVEIVGDLPIFVSHDSADVWANQGLFHLDEGGEPSVVAGVPPDYFSETGQLWGNPLYDWERMAGEGYAWWVRRMRRALELYDAVRVDHFRGFAAHWEIPAEAESAKRGRWVEGPGRALFDKLEKELGELPVIAEDLGEITAEVEALRDGLGLPGMKVLQFAFSGPDNHFLPHNYGHEEWVVYTGTHDNDTTAGWWTSASREEREYARRYLGREYAGVEDLIRLAYASTARRAVVPMQDHLGLGSGTRMNTPGTTEGNWSWGLSGGELTTELASGIREKARIYGRLGS